ncbi:MAG: TonB-dependent receptor [Bacteroidota bacterium]
MKKIVLLLFLTASITSLYAQVTISGIVSDDKGAVLPGSNVYIKGGYDGSTSAADGSYTFTTDEKGEVTVVVSLLGFESQEKKITVGSEKIALNFKLREKANELNTVTISAGSFEASDEKKIVMLRPLDIVTTAGAAGDIYGALQTLPGTQQVGETEGLFVRGGDAREAKTFIDGVLVDNPYFTSVPDVPQRSRFSPFLFKGTYFSTGGYSAQYGQAMSSALILESQDMPKTTTTNIGIMSVGGGIGHVHKFKNSSVGANINYFNLSPYFALSKQNRDWHTDPQGGDASVTYRQKIAKNGLLKFFVNTATSKLSVDYNDIENPEPESRYRFSLKNKNVFTAASYKDIIANKYTLQVASAYSVNHDDLMVDVNDIEKNNSLYQNRIVISRLVKDLSIIRVGGEYQHAEIDDRFTIYKRNYLTDFGSAFAEGDIYITRKLMSRAGVRVERSGALDEMNVAPRISLAYKTGSYSQFSMAYGQFYQEPDYHFVQQQEGLKFEQADHYILNFQTVSDKQTFRVEGYYKIYNNLTLTEPQINNEGEGYSRGIDIFWRDKKTLKYTDYWISYSYLDTKRKYLDFPEKVTPTFAANHTVSVVYKRWFTKQRLSLGFTYAFATGRPYNDPNKNSFMSEHTKSYHNLSINSSKLMMIGKHFTVLVFSIDNVLGVKNIYTYRYSSDGLRRQTVGPEANRFYFIGLFISIGEDKTE